MKLPVINESIFESYKNPVENKILFYIIIIIITTIIIMIMIIIIIIIIIIVWGKRPVGPCR